MAVLKGAVLLRLGAIPVVFGLGLISLTLFYDLEAFGFALPVLGSDLHHVQW